MSKIDKAVAWAVDIANDNTHGYSQTVRWGNSYDCSSLIISAWQNAGVPVKTAGATFTGNMYPIFCNNGFADVTSGINLNTGAGLKKGDVLLNKADHTAMCIDSNTHYVVHARSSEGTSDTADNSGNEIRTQPYWNYPWDCVLRYMKDNATDDSNVVVEAPEENKTPTILYMPVDLPIIKPSMSRMCLESVKALQTICNLKGAHLNVDGYYGISTQTFIYTWQKNHPSCGTAGQTPAQRADKEVGALTWLSLITEKAA